MSMILVRFSVPLLLDNPLPFSLDLLTCHPTPTIRHQPDKLDSPDKVFITGWIKECSILLWGSF